MHHTHSHTCPALLGQLLHDGVQLRSEAHVKEPVCFIKYKDFQTSQVHGCTLLHDVQQPSRRANQYICTLCGELCNICCNITAVKQGCVEAGFNSMQTKDTEQRGHAAMRETHVPPTSRRDVISGTDAKKGSATLYICPASSRVGDTMIAPT